MKKIIIPLLAAGLFGCIGYTIPTSAVERAVEVCEPQGGLESISGESENGVRFVCGSGEVHYMYRINTEKQK